MPPEAATWREDTSDWTNRDELAALAYEAINHWGYLTVGVLSNWKVELPPPQRLLTHPDRAEPEPPKPAKATKQQILQFFGQLKGG